MQFLKPHYYPNINILHYTAQEGLTCFMSCLHCIKTKLKYRGNVVSSGTYLIHFNKLLKLLMSKQQRQDNISQSFIIKLQKRM
jgi:hypothetical protein